MYGYIYGKDLDVYYDDHTHKNEKQQHLTFFELLYFMFHKCISNKETKIK